MTQLIAKQQTMRFDANWRWENYKKGGLDYVGFFKTFSKCL